MKTKEVGLSCDETVLCRNAGGKTCANGRKKRERGLGEEEKKKEKETGWR